MLSGTIAAMKPDLIIFKSIKSEFYIGRFISCRFGNSTYKILKKD